MTRRRKLDSYTVTSDRLVGHEQGSTVDDDDLSSCNVSALLAGGHIVPSTAPKEK